MLPTEPYTLKYFQWPSAVLSNHLGERERRGSIHPQNLNTPSPNVLCFFKNKCACKAIMTSRCEKDLDDRSSLIPCPSSDSQLCLLASLASKEGQGIWPRVWSTQGGSCGEWKGSVSQGCQAGTFKTATQIKLLEAPQTMTLLWQEERASAWEEGRTDRGPNARAQPQQFNVGREPSILQVGYLSPGVLCLSVSQRTLSPRTAEVRAVPKAPFFSFMFAVQGTVSPVGTCEPFIVPTLNVRMFFIQCLC